MRINRLFEVWRSQILTFRPFIGGKRFYNIFSCKNIKYLFPGFSVNLLEFEDFLDELYFCFLWSDFKTLDSIDQIISNHQHMIGFG